MKENVQYKNEALASLKGNWPQSVLGILILLLISYALVAPMYAMILKDPTDLEAITAAQNRFTPLIWILSIFFIDPLQLGYVISFKVVATEEWSGICSGLVLAITGVTYGLSCLGASTLSYGHCCSLCQA